MSIQLVLVTLFLAVACLSAAKLAVVPALASRAEHRKAEARKAFEKETDRLEQLCEIGPYSKLSLWIAAEEERERQAAINAQRREINETRQRVKQKREAELAAEGERRLRESRTTCRDGGEHVVATNALKCRVCGKPYNPFVPSDYRTQRHLAQQAEYRRAREDAAKRRQKYLAAGYVEKATARVSDEAVKDFLRYMEHEIKKRNYRG